MQKTNEGRRIERENERQRERGNVVGSREKDIIRKSYRENEKEKRETKRKRERDVA